MQVRESVDPQIIFTTYSYSSSVNRTLAAHFAEMAEVLHGMARDGLVAEFGCNDGVLLNPLRKLGARVVGIDPSDVAQRASAENGWPLVRNYFNRETASQVRAEHGPAAVITANNVCAHVEDPNVLMEGVAQLLADDGSFVFEVHYQGDLLADGQYDTVYHEHTCYYSLVSLQKLLARHGLRVVNVRRIPIHCGSIRVTAVREESGKNPDPSVAAMVAEERHLDARGFTERAHRHRLLLRKVIADLVSSGKKVAAYGASGRATILINFCGLGPDLLDHVSDLSPLRYGRVVPGVGVPIRPRSEFRSTAPDYALITAWNYEAEIVRDEREFLAQGNAFIVPLPEIRII
jgi:novobiocin biosynthesis protein NovU/D-mycarose 3-C-methyltransferase